jgi:hypothetical protein
MQANAERVKPAKANRNPSSQFGFDAKFIAD